MPRVLTVLLPIAAAGVTLSAVAQSTETVLTGVAVLQQCTSAERACVSGPNNTMVAVRIEHGAAALAERTGPILLVVGTADTIPAPAAPPPTDGELGRLLARAGVARGDSLPARVPATVPTPVPAAVPVAVAGAQPAPAVDEAAAASFAGVYAKRAANAGVGVIVLDLPALRRHPRFEPTRTVRVIWTGAEGRTYAVVVKVP